MRSVQAKLSSVDWDFVSSKSKKIHAIHPYPARFIPEVPSTLIDLFYQNDGSAVLDPFCGSGTTLVEAFKRSIVAVGVDLNPLACLITKVKLTPIYTSELLTARDNVFLNSKHLSQGGSISIPAIPNLDHWFKPSIQRALACLNTSISSISNCHIRDVLKVALSSIIVRVSNQESNTRYAAIEKLTTQEDTFSLFSRAVSSIAIALKWLEGDLFMRKPLSSVINKDILTMEPEDIPYTVGLVITSPPYPNAYEYWLYHKYRMYWLGMDPLAVKSREIGARPHYFKRNHQTEKDFERQMTRCFWLLARVMRTDAKACFLVGRSIIHGRYIDNCAILKRAATQNGFVLEGITERNILITRKAFNPSHGKITKENVAVFRLKKKP